MKVVFHQVQSFLKGNFPSKVIFHQRLSSFKGPLQIKVRLLYNVVFYQRLSIIESCLSAKIIFDQRLFSLGGHLPSQVLFKPGSSSISQRLSSSKCNFPSKVVFHHNCENMGENKEKLLHGVVILISCYAFVKLHSNLQTQLNFSWLEYELTCFSSCHNKNNNNKNPQLTSTRMKGPNMSDIW